jgi:cysteine desulfurase
MKRQVYLDNAAATPTDPAVHRAMEPFLNDNFSNPSGLYNNALEARKTIDKARKQVADKLFTQPDTIIFTSSGTESINLALLGLARKQLKISNQKSSHIITTTIEHKAVLEPIRKLESEGFNVTYLDVDSEGFVNINDFKNTLRPETFLVSIQYANNEIGTIQPIADIGRELLKFRRRMSVVSGQRSMVVFHVDACQAAAYLDLNVEKLHVDLMSINGSKIYGPKGTGVLYKRRGVEIEPLMYGGGHEFGLRPGTENVAGIVGIASAISNFRFQISDLNRIGKLRDYFWKSLHTTLNDITLNGPPIKSEILNQKSEISRLPNNLNITLKGIDSEALIIYLSEHGIEASTGSACTIDSDDVSHVQLAIGKSEDEARSSIRFTLGKDTNKKDVDYVLSVIPIILKKLNV